MLLAQGWAPFESLIDEKLLSDGSDREEEGEESKSRESALAAPAPEVVAVPVTTRTDPRACAAASGGAAAVVSAVSSPAPPASGAKVKSTAPARVFRSLVSAVALFAVAAAPWYRLAMK